MSTGTGLSFEADHLQVGWRLELGRYPLTRSLLQVTPGDPIGKPIEPPASLLLPTTWPRSDVLADLRLYRKPVSRATGQPVDWAKEIREAWQFGEEGGYANLQKFLDEGLPHYQDESSRADHKE